MRLNHGKGGAEANVSLCFA